jgi:serine/threonine protein kinase
MAVEAASGLYHLHCEGVIHRVPTDPHTHPAPITRLLTLDACAAHDTQDIAARNCLVGENYHIFVTDFGFARIKENATAEYARTLNAVGPVKHMSPEAMREKVRALPTAPLKPPHRLHR